MFVILFYVVCFLINVCPDSSFELYTLCYFTGLVMPSFVTTKADMILNGILPIDQMRDHRPAVNALAHRIPR